MNIFIVLVAILLGINLLRYTLGDGGIPTGYPGLAYLIIGFFLIKGIHDFLKYCKGAIVNYKGN